MSLRALCFCLLDCVGAPFGCLSTSCIGVGYHKKGYPKQEPKILLKPCKNQSQRTTTRSRQTLRLAQSLHRGLRRKAKALRPTEALSLGPPRRGPASQCVGWDANSPIRPRLGSATTSSTLPRPAPLTRRHVQINAPNYSRNVSRTLAQFGQND